MANSTTPDYNPFSPGNQPFLWMYVIFVYFFTGLAIRLLVNTTTRIIGIRQGYLGSKSTLTDRTLRLSGIPESMRTEESITAFIENLNIGKVENVMICKDWKSLDKLIAARLTCLRRLEEAWTVHLGFRRIERNNGSLPIVQPPPPAPEINGEEEEDSRLLSGTQMDSGHITPYARDRPTTRIWYGPFNSRSRKIDAIDYYEEKLRQLDEQIRAARQKEYKPMPLAFVTMESIAACQMAVQAILDPIPRRLLASLAPPPADVLWQNTYLPRSTRMLRSWGIMVLIGFLTIFWAFTLAPLAALINVAAIDAVLPGFAALLDQNPVVRSLVTTGLPTLGLSLLTVAVPYLYDWLSNMQGMTSQGDVELSIISKNWFFVFFNLFVMFTVFGTASKFYEFWSNLRDVLTDTSSIANALATSLTRLAPFYENLIVLQGFGLFPFRLLEFGAVAMYPIFLLGAKTPRGKFAMSFHFGSCLTSIDYAELVQPPVFSYGFYLPQSILIFNICTVYSVLPSSWLMQLFGLIYFCIGRFIYKYQLLYAMDHRHHSTGRAWPMICNRIMVGLVVFQIAMVGVLALNKAITRSVLLLPALAGTIWFNIYFQQTYQPLMKFIALRSINREDDSDLPALPTPRWDRDIDQGDSDRDRNLRYINPSINAPLDELWVHKRGPGTRDGRAV
ncbi:MAG: hypothetical protein Q9227_007955 [Pyrenula ochraceoflavens]